MSKVIIGILCFAIYILVFIIYDQREELKKIRSLLDEKIEHRY